MDKTLAETAAESRAPEGSMPTAPKDSADHSVTTQDSNQLEKDANQQQEQQQQQQQPAQSFAAAVFPGFNPPKINTSSFFSSMSSMQGKIQSTLANAKSPTLNLHAPHINKVDVKQLQASTEQLANTTKDWGINAFKSLSGAAQRVSANVTQGIQKEHEEFVKQKKLETVVPHQGTESLPAWAGMPDEEKIKARILSLSKDKRNFLLPPPLGNDFIFDMNVYSSTAVATLKADPNLEKMRFYLVPKEVEELVFWRNYFYRVSLLKQFALAAAAGGPDSLAEVQSGSTTEDGTESSKGTGNGRPLSESSALGYNIYFGKDDIEGPPKRSRPTSVINKDPNTTSTSSTTSVAAKDTAAKDTTAKDTEKAPAKKQEAKPEVLFEAEMPAHDEDPDAWLEKQLASGVSIGDDDADVDVGDWEKELQNELKDYVEAP
ncbi:Synapse-associated protein 1 [Entomortierella chlamydospora]|uniref:Synapse-associated protein 1 n=1 Tax=Entomortierella chlamydospora TaxID=101097 RepID=A0A9P6N174_9FUNG|nr:Synapse-associated protein 1 [Entomortierella chlamydospora]